MPDWRELVEERLDGADLTPQQNWEIAAELASHLEELCDEHKAHGVPESEAIDRALEEVCDWNELARRIRRAKREEEVMNDRVRHLWLPGLANFLGAVLFGAALAQWSYQPHELFRSHLTQLMYALWLVGQVVCGGVGAFLSRRAGGNRPARLTAALFTSAIWLISMLIVIGVSAFLRVAGLGNPNFGSIIFQIFPRALAVMIVVPSAAMLLGALPFLSDRRPVSPEAGGRGLVGA